MEIGKAPRDQAIFYRLILTKDMHGYLLDHFDAETFYGKELIKWVDESLTVSKAQLLRGDIVELATGIKGDPVFYYIFDGKRLVVFNPNPDPESDSTVPPPSFQVVTEFPIHYWDSNPNYEGTWNEVFLDLKPFADQIVKNMQMNFDVKGKASYMTWFDYKKISYVIIIEITAVPFDQFKTIVDLVDKSIKNGDYGLSPQPQGSYNQMAMTNNVLFMKVYPKAMKSV